MDITNSDIENFLINNARVSEIEAYLTKFNPLTVMKIEKMEIRHSAILGWLLNPNGNHGIGDWFLKAFLSEALKGTKLPISALDVFSSELSSANVYIEHDNIDILIEIPNEKWIFIIENKVGSKQSKNQLKKYRELMEKRFSPKSDSKDKEEKKYKICGVFLTLNYEEPDDDKYAPIRYVECHKLLALLLKQHRDSLSSKVLDFIHHYTEVVERECNMSDENEDMIQLAKKLYREHKDVIKFIYEQGNATEFRYAVEELFKDKSFELDGYEYRQMTLSHNTVSYLPETWIGKLGEVDSNKLPDGYLWHGCEKYWGKYPFILFITLSDNKLRLSAELGPLTDHELRLKIIKSIMASKKEGIQHFGKNAEIEGAKFSRFNKSKDFTINIKDEYDSELLKEKIKELISKAQNTIAEPMEDVIDKIMED